MCKSFGMETSKLCYDEVRPLNTVLYKHMLVHYREMKFLQVLRNCVSMPTPVHFDWFLL